jgi:glycoside/pentoside/hexuronide:cation symporter, GPH family
MSIVTESVKTENSVSTAFQTDGLKTTTKAEKFLYSLGDVGSNFVWTFAASFLTLYYTDSAGISAAFIGTMMLVARLLDGVSDIAVGIMIDKTKTRWGKARPWLLFTVVPFALSLVLLFNVPGGFSESAKNAYVAGTYIFMVVIYTALNLPYHAMLPLISKSSQDRNTVSTVRMIVSLIVIVFISYFTIPLVTAFGGTKSQGAWLTISEIYAVLAFICIIATFLGVKEKVSAITENEKKVPVKEALHVLFSNRYFYIAVLLFFATYISNGSTGIGIYYAKDVLGNGNIFGTLSIMTLLPLIIGMPIAPQLFKKFGKRNVMLYGLAIAIISNALMFINPANAVLLITLTAIRSIGIVPMTVAIFTLASDIVEYNEWKTGIRAEGITTSANVFGMKLGTGIGSALLGWLLAWGHYDGALTTQPQSAITAMIVLQIGVPLIVYILSFILILFWNMEKYQPQIQEYMISKDPSI